MDPPVGLGLGHLKLDGMEFLKRVGFQVYQNKEQLILNKRDNTGLSVIRDTLADFTFQGKVAIVLFPMIFESDQ